MKFESLSIAVLGLTLAWFAPAVAADPQAAPAAATTAAPDTAGQKPLDPANELVCKRVEVTGSHMAKDRVCKTRKAWKAEEEDDGDNATDVHKQYDNHGSQVFPR